MPHTTSAKKHLRKSDKRRRANRVVKKDIKISLKSFTDAVDGPITVLRDEYSKAAKQLDKAAARRTIHPNLAARKKSQMATALHAREIASKGN